MIENESVEIHVSGMDCVDCTLHVRKAIADLPGVSSVEVYLASEKAVIQMDPDLVQLGDIKGAVEKAGYSVLDQNSAAQLSEENRSFSRVIFILLGILFGVVLFTVIVGEWLGLFDVLTAFVPWPVWAALVVIIGYPVFRSVLRATLQRQIIAHTLMTVGVLAALVSGQWATAMIVTFFMRIGDYVERFTTEKARQSVKGLVDMAPQKARVEREGGEFEIPVEQVEIGETVVLRPGDKIPVDGAVMSGYASIDQAAITGEAMPLEAGPGSEIYAASLVQSGSLKVRALQVGAGTTFGQVVKLVEEAETRKADVQRMADRFSGYFLPLVAVVALFTFIIRRDPMATVAVLVVACSCAFALATPIAMLASIGAGARRGIMIKGGKFIELLDQVQVLLIDKTGTLTFGKPEIVDIELLNYGIEAGEDEDKVKLEVLRLAASAERFSEHPLAKALVYAASVKKIKLVEPQEFRSVAGFGVTANVDGKQIEVGRRRMFEIQNKFPEDLKEQLSIEDSERSLIYVGVDGVVAAVLAVADVMRAEVPSAMQDIFALGINEVKILTGDRQKAAADLVGQIKKDMSKVPVIKYSADLLPEDKIRIVKEYQADGYMVVMVGDGVNDAPALAQADVGIAMGAVGSDIAIEAAHVALMRDDWSLVPEVFRISHRTMRVVRINILFTGLYNLVGLSLAALGILPPVLAAAAQSIPDLGILANSSRLLRQK